MSPLSLTRTGEVGGGFSPLARVPPVELTVSKSFVVRAGAICAASIIPVILAAGPAAAGTEYSGTLRAVFVASGAAEATLLAENQLRSADSARSTGRAGSFDIGSGGRGGGGSFACVASPLPMPSTPPSSPSASPSRTAPTPASPTSPASTPHISPLTVLPAIPVGRAEPFSASPPTTTPSAAIAPIPPRASTPAATKKSRGLLPLMARHLRRHLPLLLILLLVAVIPAVLAATRRAGSASSR